MSSPVTAFPAPIPTADEVASLISLVPSASPSSYSPSLLAVLAEVLAPCRIPGALDFLINPDINPLSVLTSPLNRHAACSSDVTITAVQPPDPSDPSADRFNTHFKGLYAFIPAFNIADTQLGFGIRQCHLHCQGNLVFPRCGQGRHPAIFRFLRNDSAHVLLLIQDHFDPVINFDYMRLLNGSTRRRHFVAVSRPALHALHRSHSTFEPLQLAPHVILYNSCTERRDCTACGNPASEAPCFCVVNTPKPLHAFDFDVMHPAMSAHLGSYEGLASNITCAQGVQIHSALLGSRMTITARVDSDLIERLSRWVITEQLSKAPDNPLKDMLLASSPVCSRSTSSNESAPANDHSSSGTTSSADISSVQLATTPLPQTLSTSQMTAILHVLGEAQMSPVTTLQHANLANNNVPNGSYETRNITDLCSQPLQSNHDPIITPDQMEDVDQWPASIFELPIPQSTTQRCEKTPSQQPPPCGVIDEDLELSDLIVEDAAADFVTENSNVPATGIGQPKAVTIAPAGGMVPVVISKSKQQEEKDRKAEMRKQRNREAAQRSNLKRKLRNDTLKAELKKWHGKATELRNKELGLREENLSLRKQLSGG